MYIFILFAELAKPFAFHIYDLATAIFWFKDVTWFYYISKMKLEMCRYEYRPITPFSINQSINQ